MALLRLGNYFDFTFGSDQVGAWMRNSQKFFDVCIHPMRRSDEAAEFPGHAQFCCGLLTLVVTKMRHDIADVIYDDVTLSHLIDEVIFFSRDLLSKDFALFIPLEHLPLVVLCDPPIFGRLDFFRYRTSFKMPKIANRLIARRKSDLKY